MAYPRERLRPASIGLRASIGPQRSDQPRKIWVADYRERMRMTPIQFQPSQRLPDPEKLGLIRADSRHSVLFRVPKRSGIFGSDPWQVDGTRLLRSPGPTVYVRH